MITAKKGNYVFGLKGNQGTLFKQTEVFFKYFGNSDKTEVFEAPVEKGTDYIYDLLKDEIKS